MDSGTSSFYDAYASTLCNGTESSRSAMFTVVERHFGPEHWVLDVGAGSGRDVVAMLAVGIEAYGIEPNAPMREHALATHPALHGRLRDATLPALGHPFSDIAPDGFDGVVCSAVLMHVSPAELPVALFSLVAQLRKAKTPDAPARQRPTLLISIPTMDTELLRQDRDADGRRFHNHDPRHIAELLSPLGLTLLSHETSDVVLASTGTRWHTMAFVCTT